VKKPFNIGDLLSAIETSSPRQKEPAAKKPKIVEPMLKRSGLYLSEELEGEKGMEVFRSLIANGYNGLAFTRKHPDVIRDMAGDEELPIVWFTSTPVKDQTCISPLNIQKMLIMIQSAMASGERSAVFVWGFEYILTNINFDRALNLIQVLNDRVMTSSDCMIIFSMDLDILGERERKLISREFEKI
jgi:hypothetical protein